MVWRILVRWRLWHKATQLQRPAGIRALLTTRTALILATGLLLLAMACGSSGSESSPSLVTTSTPIPTAPTPTPSPEPTSTPVPTPKPEPTSTPSPDPRPEPTAMSKGDQAAAITGGEGSLLPIVVFGNVTPDEIMSQFPAAEGDCLKEHLSADRMAEILQTASPTILEGIVIAGCLETITFVRLFVGGFLPESGTYSDSTNACLLERMADTELVRTAGLYMMISMGNIEDPSSAFEILPFLFCLNDEERADADLDLDAVECVVNELGPEALQALSNLGEDDSPPPPTLVAAMTKCGFTEPPS